MLVAPVATFLPFTFVDDLLHCILRLENAQVRAGRSKRVAKGSQPLSDGFALDYFKFRRISH
jgi:hypothetical protein